MNGVVRLKTAYKKLVTEQLKAYYPTKELLEDMEAEIAESGIVMHARLTPRSKKITKPTEDKAARMADVTIIHTMRKTINAIEFVKDRSFGKKAEVLKDYFFEGKPYQAVCTDRNISQPRLFQIRNEIITDVAELLGYTIK
jgi:RinA family phage transcriptional activator